jgi:hypothetical protein
MTSDSHALRGPSLAGGSMCPRSPARPGWLSWAPRRRAAAPGRGAIGDRQRALAGLYERYSEPGRLARLLPAERRRCAGLLAGKKNVRGWPAGDIRSRPLWISRWISRLPALEHGTLAKGQRIDAALTALAQSVSATPVTSRGRGLAHGLAFEHGELARKVSSAAFERGLLVETAGPGDEVIKLLPPLTATDTEIDQGLAFLADAVRTVC